MHLKLEQLIPAFLIAFVVLMPRLELFSIPGIASKIRVESVGSFLNILLLLTVFTIRGKITKKVLFPYGPIAIILLSLSILASFNLKFSIIYFLKYVELFSFFVSGYLFARYSQNFHSFNTYINFITIVVLILTVADIFDVTLIDSYNNHDGGAAKGRVSASFNLNYDLAAFLGLAFFHLWILSSGKKPYVFLYAIWILTIIYILGSRSAQLSVSVAFLYLSCIHGKSFKTRRIFFILIIISNPVALTLLTITGSDSVSIAHRIMIWTSVLSKMDPINYLIGGGAGFINLVTSEIGYPGTAAESFYFRVLFEHGVLGLAIYALIIYKFYIGSSFEVSTSCEKSRRAVAQKPNSYQALLSTIVVYLLYFGLFIDINFSTKFAVYCYFLIGVCWAKVKHFNTTHGVLNA